MSYLLCLWLRGSYKTWLSQKPLKSDQFQHSLDKYPTLLKIWGHSKNVTTFLVAVISTKSRIVFVKVFPLNSFNNKVTHSQVQQNGKTGCPARSTSKIQPFLGKSNIIFQLLTSQNPVFSAQYQNQYTNTQLKSLHGIPW